MTGLPTTNTRYRKVRIKVLINELGEYCGMGWQDAGEKDPDDTIYESISGLNVREYWITADVPIPANAEEIQGGVES